MNNKAKTPTNQAQLTKNLTKVSFSELSVFKKKLLQLTKGQRRELECLLYLWLHFERVFPKQVTIGKYAGVRREHSNIATTLFDNLGLVTKINRGYTTCEYFVNSLFLHPLLREFLKQLLPAFATASLLLITSIPPEFVEKSVVTSHLIENRTPNKNIVLKQTQNSLNTVFIQERVTNREEDTQRSLRFCEAQTSWPGLGNKISKKPERRNKKMSLEVTNIQSEVKSLRLSQWGALRLSVFPVEALRYADREIQKAKTVRSPFGLFESLCKKYISLKGIDPDMQRRVELSVPYDIPEYPEYLEEKTVFPVDEYLSNTKTPFKGMSRAERAEQQASIVTKEKELLEWSIAKQKEWNVREMEEVRKDPARLAIRQARAKQFRDQIGIDENANFTDDRTPQQRADALLSAFGGAIRGENIPHSPKSPPQATQTDLSTSEQIPQSSVPPGENMTLLDEGTFIDNDGRKKFMVRGKPSSLPF